MAVTDPVAVAFCNVRIRPAADKIARLFYELERLVDDWNAQGMSARIPNTSDVVSDGSPADGRSPITGAQATNIIVRASEVVADYEATNNAKLNTVLAVSVNPNPA